MSKCPKCLRGVQDCRCPKIAYWDMITNLASQLAAANAVIAQLTSDLEVERKGNDAQRRENDNLTAELAAMTVRAEKAAAAAAEYRDTLDRLLHLVRHETNLPGSAANGVTDCSGRTDEGVIRADEIMDLSRRMLTKPNPGQALLDELAAANAARAQEAKL